MRVGEHIYILGEKKRLAQFFWCVFIKKSPYFFLFQNERKFVFFLLVLQSAKDAYFLGCGEVFFERRTEKTSAARTFNQMGEGECRFVCERLFMEGFCGSADHFLWWALLKMLTVSLQKRGKDYRIGERHVLIIINSMISVLIASKNRPEKLLACLRSIGRNTLQDYEVVVVEQSRQLSPRLLQYARSHQKVRVIHAPDGGKSVALMKGLAQIRGQIVAFTDDDCVVSKNWLSVMKKSFSESSCGAVFGQVFPFEPEKHRGKICPCTIGFEKKEIIHQPRYHVTIGYGNNMAFRRQALDEIGPPKAWLGPGSVGGNAEDAELTLRAIASGKKVVRDPRLAVFHNRWLTEKEMRHQQRAYTRGEAACYGFLSLQGHTFAQKVCFESMKTRLYSLKKNSQFFEEFILCVSFIFGLGVAVVFFVKEDVGRNT